MNFYGTVENNTAQRPPKVHAVLPEDMTKHDALKIIGELRQALGLTHTDLAALHKMADYTARDDWHSPLKSPTNYRKQQDMAREIGVSDRQFRRIEAKLSRAGIIDRAAADNGYRGRRSRVDVYEASAGLSFEPLITNIEDFDALAYSLRMQEEHRAQLRLEIRVARRRLRELTLTVLEMVGEHDAVRALTLAKASWPQSVARESDVAFLEAHLSTLQSHAETLEAVVDNLNYETQMSGAPDIDVPCHIQPTTITNNEICNDNSYEKASGKPDETKYLTPPPDGSGDGLENKHGGGDGLLNPEFRARLTVEAIQDAASDEMKFYIENLRSPGTARAWSDIEKAVVMRLAELGINPSAYQGAQDQMGWLEALLSVVIIDRNTNHPTTPIRSAGGALRAFTARAAKGQLNLERSLFGIWGRDEKAMN